MLKAKQKRQTWECTAKPCWRKGSNDLDDHWTLISVKRQHICSGESYCSFGDSHVCIICIISCICLLKTHDHEGQRRRLTARGQYFCLARIPINVLRDYRKCKLCRVQFPFRDSDPRKTPPHSAGSALSSAVQDALGLCGKGTLLAYTHLVHQDSQVLFLQSHPSAWAGAWGWSSPGTGLCSSLCWTS